ncbi:MAG: dTDP-4-dehydrorhamnose 3,5-epimerase [Afipia sp.]|nr:dTDP-4-dehydrorhamnose 3,5-epimerase [Afipia sp.]OJW64398.1 MAG: dTDP-4-dehydrorhamnose 3,5-epimerase [Afipia sp. 64-13]
MQLNVLPLPIADVKLITTSRLTDARGYFCEAYVRSDFVAQGLDCDFVQDNESRSDRAGTVRGLHFQKPPFAQAKLVRVLRGKILDVVVDLRCSSPSFGRHLAVELGESGGEQLFVPAGFAHGFCTLEPDTVVLYKVDATYSPTHDHGINWADPALAIRWPVAPEAATVSDKDRKLPMLGDLSPVFD